MKVLVLFSFEVSLRDWIDSGLYDREISLYEKMSSRFGGQFTLFTYGDEADLETNHSTELFPVVPAYEGRVISRHIWWRWLASFILPLKFSGVFRAADVYKTNQMMGAWVGVIAKLVFRKPLLLRCGYDLSQHLRMEGAKWWIRAGAWFISFICYQTANHIFVPTREIKDRITKQFLLSPKKIDVHPNFVDIERFSPPIVAGQFREGILCVGRLSSQKNIQLIIDAISGTELKLKLIGAGEMEPLIKKQILEGAVDITMLSNVANFDLPRHYQESLIYVMCSRHEGHPKALLEAMSCECAVVGTDVIGINNLIDDQRIGVLVAEDPDKLREVLLELSEDRERCARLGKAARTFVGQKFSLSDIAEREWFVHKTLTDR
jgi:glycosyltransferase involved in cell wall biosynthesis